MKKNNVAIITGEISGDLYAYELGKVLQKHDVYITGIGGDKLASISDNFILNIAHENIIGIEAFFQISLKKRLKAALKKLVKNNTLTCIILIDFQHHHHLIAKTIQKHNIPIITFITPNFWIWKDIKKAKEVISYSTDIVTIFKKEYLFYKSLTPHVHFFGHPLPFIKQTPEQNDIPHLDSKTSIAIFPGSRKQEFKLYLVPICEAIKHLISTHKSQTYSFHMALSAPEFLPLVQKTLLYYNLEKHIHIWDKHQSHLLRHSKALICATGTTTLEGILSNKPMVILCGLSPLTYWVAKHIMKLSLPFISLPNIMADKEIVPELIQCNVTSVNIIKSLTHVLALSGNEITAAYTPIKDELTQNNPFEGISNLVLKKS